MNSHEHDPETTQKSELARRVATEGAAIAYESYRSSIPVESKAETQHPGPADVVTEADRNAQRRIIELLKSNSTTGSVSIVGEEGSVRKDLPPDGTAWVVDPIDGTYNYVRGFSRWATSVAAVEDGVIQAAATVAPALDDTYVATTETAKRNGSRISVSSRTRSQNIIVAPVMLPALESRRNYSEGVSSALNRFADVRRIGSLQMALALVAAGAIDVAVTPRTPNPWDSLAGVGLIRAAGGKVTDTADNEWRYDSNGLVASNGSVHDVALDIVRSF